MLGVVVEVVGRLVQQQQVASREQDASEFDATPFTAGERVERQVEPVVAETEARGDGANIGLRAVPAAVSKLFLHAGEAGRVALRAGLVDLQSQLLHAQRELVEPFAGQHVGEPGGIDARTTRVRVLGEVSDGRGVRDDPGSGGGFTGDDFEHRGLPGPVPADQSDGVAGVQRERRIVDAELASDFD